MTPPSFVQVTELPPSVEATVTPDWIDINGHMNIRHYFDLGASGILEVCLAVGVDDAYRAERQMGLFTAEHHLRYYSEVHEGSRLTGHLRVLGRSEKAMHLMVLLVDHTREALACTLEAVILHVDLQSRRTAPLPADVAARVDGLVADGDALPWGPPVCGAMGVRRDAAAG